MRDPLVRRVASAVLLIVLVALAWANGLHGEFTYDDKVEVIGNPTIRFLENWREVLSYNLSRPLLILTYSANYELAGMDPFTWHLVDVVLQAINAVLALLVGEAVAEAAGVKRSLRFGLIAAALWAVHPLATESVSYVTGRSEQLVATFYLLACQRWLRWLLEEDRTAWAQAWAVFVLAAFTKEVAVTLPIAMLLLEVQVLRQGAVSKVRWRSYWPAAVLLGFFFLLRWWLYGALTSPMPLLRDPVEHLWTQSEVVWRYLQLSVVPVGQSIFHDHPVTGLTPRSGLALAGLVVLTGLALRDRSRAPILALGWLWCLVVLLPATVVPLKETMAEHRFYLSLLGVCWVAGALLARLPAAGAVGVTAALVVAAVVATQARNEAWATEVSIWTEATHRNPTSGEAWYGLGDAYRLSGDLVPAAEAYERALALDPEMLDGWTNLGIVRVRMGQGDAAEAAWKKALRKSPTYCKAHNNLALYYARGDELELALREFRTTLQYCPEDVTAYYFLGRLYEEKLGELDKAVQQYQAILELEDDSSYAEDARQRILNLTW